MQTDESDEHKLSWFYENEAVLIPIGVVAGLIVLFIFLVRVQHHHQKSLMDQYLNQAKNNLIKGISVIEDIMENDHHFVLDVSAD